MLLHITRRCLDQSCRWWYRGFFSSPISRAFLLVRYYCKPLRLRRRHCGVPLWSFLFVRWLPIITYRKSDNLDHGLGMMLRRYVHSLLSKGALLRIMDTYLPLSPPGIHYFARPRTVSVCLSVGLSVPSHISKSAFPNFTKFAVRVTCGRASVTIRRQCNTLCTSGFVDDVMFSVMGQVQIQAWSLQRSELFTWLARWCH